MAKHMKKIPVKFRKVGMMQRQHCDTNSLCMQFCKYIEDVLKVSINEMLSPLFLELLLFLRYELKYMNGP